MPHVRQTCPGLPWSEHGKQTTRIVEVLLLELEASARAAEITLHAQDRDGERSWVRRMLGRGSIATGSVGHFGRLSQAIPIIEGRSHPIW